MEKVGISNSIIGRFVWVVFWVEENSVSKYWNRDNDKEALILSNLSISFFHSFNHTSKNMHLGASMSVIMFPSKGKLKRISIQGKGEGRDKWVEQEESSGQ